MRRPIVAANWKMNGSPDSATELVAGVLAGVSSVDQTEMVICPPFILIPMVQERLSGSAVAWGGQNLDIHESGAYTGEVAGSMLVDFGCRYCIVGHSERRALYNESNDVVAQKFEQSQACGLTPILCVGETLAQREHDHTEQVISAQLDAVLERVGIETFAAAVVAYEPVWAIGTGRTASPEQAQAVHAFIRAKFADLDTDIAARLRIQYGGSVKAENADELFAQTDIDGGLIGGASLHADQFLAICRAT